MIPDLKGIELEVRILLAKQKEIQCNYSIIPCCKLYKRFGFSRCFVQKY